MAFNHVTVLLKETVDSLNVKKGGVYADMTLGGGGHTALILERGGRVFGFDRDIAAIENAKKRFSGMDFVAVHSNFSRIKEETQRLGIEKFDGIIADLGVSSPQLDDAQRGFSYMQEKMEVDPNYFFKETAFLHTFLSFLNQDGNNDEEQLEEL